MTSLKNLLLNLLLILPFFSFSQEVAEEYLLVEDSNLTYQIIHKETVGDYFRLKRYVFANDTSVIAVEKNFSNGHQNGITRVFFPSGKLRIKALYGNDKLQGEWKMYREDGVIHTKGVYNYGVKHGYWAYKEYGLFGRYVKGKKHRNWKKKDKNGVKHKGWFWKGEFKRGAEIFNDNYITYADTAYGVESDTTLHKEVVELNIEKQYIKAVGYLAGNYYLRKITKDYFRPSKKKRKIFIDENVDYDRDVLNLQVASAMVPVDISYFLEQKKLLKPTLDSLIKANGEVIKKEVLAFTKTNNDDLPKLSTVEDAKLIIYLSKITDKLVVLEILENSSEETDCNLIYENQANIRMRVLVLLNDKNEVVEVEYEKRKW